MNDLAEIDNREIAKPVSPTGMIQLAIQKGMDAAAIRELNALRKELKEEQARDAFIAAFAAFKKNPPSVLKNKLVDFPTAKGRTTYMHATVDNVCEALDPALTEHGFCYRWETENLEGGIVRVTCVLIHEQGHSESTSLQAVNDSSGGKNAVQAVGSTTTYLQRYTLLLATGIVVRNADDDGNTAGHEDPALTDAQIKELADGLNSTRSDWDKFLALFRIDDLKDMKQSDFAKAKEMIEKKRRAK